MIGLYVHIPFCKRKCPYCDFFSVCGKISEFDHYTDKICESIRLAAEKYSTKADTLYFGGGTPSLIGEKRLCRILKTAQEHFDLKNAEITLEVNPEKQDIGFDVLRKNGFNRVSVGLQSAHDTELQQLGRLVGHVGKHHGRVALQSAVQGFKVNLRSFEGLLQERVLHHGELDFVLEALATQVARVLGVQSRDVNEIEMGILLQLLAQFDNDSIFYFLFHLTLNLSVTQLSSDQP